MSIDLSGVSAQSRELIPAGTYVVKCTESEVKATRNGLGKYIAAKFVIEGGEHHGRPLWTNFNIQNESEKAQQIGLGQLKGFLMAAGKSAEVLESPKDLIGLMALAAVKVKKNPPYDDANVINYFKKAADKSEPAF